MAIVKATNHVECPPKERHLRSEFSPEEIFFRSLVSLDPLVCGVNVLGFNINIWRIIAPIGIVIVEKSILDFLGFLLGNDVFTLIFANRLKVPNTGFGNIVQISYSSVF